jgi:AcrR family transcriptional regulator
VLLQLAAVDNRPASLRKLKKERSREAIVAAAYRLFAEQGFDQTTVDEIARVAEVSQRTFFRYFGTKHDVVFADRARRIARFRELLATQRAQRAPVETVFLALVELARECQANRDALLREYRIVETHPLLAAKDAELDFGYELAVAETLAGRPRGGGGKLPRRARILAGAIFGAVRATLADWFQGGCRGDLVAMGRQTQAYLESGVRAASAEEP